MRFAITATLILTATVAAQPDPEGAMGVYPVPKIVAMSGGCPDAPGFILSRGKLNAAVHEWEFGSFNIGHMTIAMPRGAVALLRAKEFENVDVEIVLRPIPSRELERIR